MPVKLKITLGPNTFDLEGDQPIDEGFAKVFATWVHAQSGASADDQRQIDETARTLRDQNQELRDGVDRSTPQS